MQLADFDLNLLVSLDALLTEQNISRAASRVGVSQSAMSKALQRARQRFDDPLLVRVGREYSLTPFAANLAKSLREVLLGLERAIEQRPTFSPEKEERVFQIACSDATELLILKPLIKILEQEAPGIRIEVQPLLGSLTGQLVERGELDLSVSSLRYYRGDLRTKVLYIDRRVCAVWTGLEGVGDTLTWDQLLTMPHAGYSWPVHDPYSDISPGEVTERDLAERITVRFSDRGHVSRLLMLPGTQLLMFTYERVAREIAKLADIKVVLPPFPPMEIPFGMLWHPRNTDDPAHRWLRNQLIEITRGATEIAA